jgi:hypothetical protein
VHRKNILICIQQDATLHSLFYPEIALNVSGGTTIYHQERIQLYLQHLVFVTPLLLPAAIALCFSRMTALRTRTFEQNGKHLETAVNVSGGNTTHHQKRIQLYLQHLVFITPLLLPAAIALCFSRMTALRTRIFEQNGKHLETAVHVSGGTSTHHQESIQLYL